MIYLIQLWSKCKTSYLQGFLIGAFFLDNEAAHTQSVCKIMLSFIVPRQLFFLCNIILCRQCFRLLLSVCVTAGKVLHQHRGFQLIIWVWQRSYYHEPEKWMNMPGVDSCTVIFLSLQAPFCWNLKPNLDLLM